MISIRWLDCFKLYEGTEGLCYYIERIVTKSINILERAYCKKMGEKKFNTPKRKCDIPVILSLTTFPARIHYVHLAIKSLLNQTVKPERIILWLEEKQFQNVEIPKQLLALCEFGLEIRYCKEDLLAHKKYYYVMQEFSDRVIVTYDDDIIYPEDSLEKLLKMHTQFPNAIICNRGREIKIENGLIAPYKYWKVSSQVPAGVPSYHVMASTGAGTLYPPHCMPEETFDIEKIREMALTADDLWMKVMSIQSGVPVVKSQTRGKALCISKRKQNLTLAHQNVDQSLNDQVMQQLLAHYPRVLDILQNDRIEI